MNFSFTGNDPTKWMVWEKWEEPTTTMRKNEQIESKEQMQNKQAAESSNVLESTELIYVNLWINLKSHE